MKGRGILASCQPIHLTFEPPTLNPTHSSACRYSILLVKLPRDAKMVPNAQKHRHVLAILGWPGFAPL